MKIMLDEWDKTSAQKELYEDVSTENIMFAGGLGSGKSYGLCRKALQLTAINNKHHGGILSPSYSDYRRDIEPQLIDILENSLGLKEGLHYFYNRSAKEWKFIWNHKPTYIFTAEKPIAGPNLAWCAINEFSLCPYDRVNEMMRRVRLKDVPRKQRILVGTPEDKHGWLEDFVSNMTAEDKPSNYFKLINSDTSENKFIDSEYRKFLESTLDPYQLKIFAEGVIGAGHPDNVYYSFDQKKNVRPIHERPTGKLYVGMDFNVNPMSATFCFYENGIFYFIDEVVLPHSNTYQMADKLTQLIDKTNAVIIPDSTGRALKTSSASVSDHDILRKAGFEIAKVHNPHVTDRVNTMNGYLHHAKIVIDPKCKNLIKDLSRLKRDNKNPLLSHVSDSAGYIVWYLAPLTTRRETRVTYY